MNKTLTTELGKYELKLATKDYLYYVNESESDENACIIMTDREGDLISSNYFAYGDYMEQLEGIIEGLIDYEYIDHNVLEQAKEYFDM